jgi:hypothetical protein
MKLRNGVLGETEEQDVGKSSTFTHVFPNAEVVSQVPSMKTC